MMCTTLVYLSLTASIYSRVENLKLQVQFEKVKVKLLKLEKEKVIRDFISRLTGDIAKSFMKWLWKDEEVEISGDSIMSVDHSSGEDNTVAVHAHRWEDGKIVVDKVEKWGKRFEEAGTKEAPATMENHWNTHRKPSHRVKDVKRVEGGIEVTIERMQTDRKKAPAKRTKAVSNRISEAMKASKEARSTTAKKQYRAGGKFAKKPETVAKKIAKKPKKV